MVKLQNKDSKQHFAGKSIGLQSMEPHHMNALSELSQFVLGYKEILTGQRFRIVVTGKVLVYISAKRAKFESKGYFDGIYIFY